MHISKPLTATLLLLTFLFSLVACGEEELPISFEDAYVIMVGNGHGVGPLNKLNVLTGEVSPLCPDPVCKHTEKDKCLMGNVYLSVVHGSNVYFVNNGKIYTDAETGADILPQTFCYYNCGTGELKALWTHSGARFEGVQGHLEYSDGYLYFCLRSGDPRETAYELWRISSSGGAPEQMRLKSSYPVTSVAVGKAYCIEKDGMYTVDLETGERALLFAFHEGKTVSVRRVDADGSVVVCRTADGLSEFVRILPDGSEEAILQLVDCKATSLYGNFIYYENAASTSLYAYSTTTKKTYHVCTLDRGVYMNSSLLMWKWICGYGIVVDFLRKDGKTSNPREGVDFDRYVYLVKDFTER